LQEILAKYISNFKKLKRGVTKYGLAPHKPVLLISILQAIKAKIIKENEINISPELICLYKSNWNSLVITKHVCNFALPFFHLSKEKKKFWHIISNPGFESALTLKESISSLNELNGYISIAKLNDDLFALAQNETANKYLQQVLLQEYFPDNTLGVDKNANWQLDLFNDIEQKILHEPSEIYRKEIKRLIVQKDEEEIFLRGSIFKREIPKIYNNTCCISGMRIDASIAVSMVDACHIIPFSVSYDDTVTNGIALCPNFHRAFDRGLIAIDENYQVMVSNSFREDETAYSIKVFEGKEIKLPNLKSYYPLKENFDWHRINVFK
jgi:putative restriction endonuclease